MNKIVFINRYFYPDHSATSQLLADLAFYLAGIGVEVEVVTSRQLYDRPDARLSGYEVIKGVKVRRIWTTRFGRQHLLGRAIDYVTFYFGAFFRLLVDVQKGDTLVAKTDPPLISVIAAIVVKIRSAMLVNWIQDLFPEVATALGVRLPSVLVKIIIGLRNWSLMTAEHNVVLGQRMASRLEENKIASQKISVIHNWSSEELITPVPHGDNRLVKEWGLVDKFVVGYSGNMGRAHEFGTILGAAEILKENDQIVFLFIGSGAQKAYIDDQVRLHSLSNVIFQPYQSRKELANSLCVPDVHLISLLPGLEGLIVPSKFYGIAAAGRATIYIGDPEGEIPRILKKEKCGDVVKIGESEALVKLIHCYSDNIDERNNLGRRARQVFEEKYASKFALDMWSSMLRN